MPLTRIRLANFKCFADSGDMPLAPLTVIFGRNNSGKSSILQSLLLLRQTLDSPEYGVRLNLRGPLYPAGSYADVVHQHQSKQHVTMRFGVDLTKQGRSGELQIECCSDEPQPPRVTRLKVTGGELEPLEIRRSRGRGGPFELTIGARCVGLEKDANFRFPVDQFLPLIGEEPSHVGRPSTKRSEIRGFARTMLDEFQKVLLNLRAVGAFRRQPERRYEYQGRVPEVVDSAGENVVNAIIEDATRRRGRAELLRMVNRWLKTVGRVRLLPLRHISRSARIFEVRLRDTDSGRWANFADVGFGIGQAFPVFVEGLRTPAGGTFLVQEPEIHLHPDAQLGMADFLVYLARSGRFVIAETHSEHLLLRIRRRILASFAGKRSRLALKPEEVSILHIDKRRDGTSHARRLEMDDLAQIRNWPRGFMEEATQERMALLQETAKHAESEG
jgi:predicted ATPase